MPTIHEIANDSLLKKRLVDEIAGPTGPVGPVGAVGPAGVTGAQGAQGSTGIQGPTGIEGPQGLQGPQGNTGIQGAQGITGVQGLQGPQGNTGSQGAQGITGVQGLQGGQGPTGAMGTTGMTGVMGPAGLQGPQGGTGVQGIQGSTGVQGLQGSQGNTGSQGAQGSTGVQGVQGNQGVTGSQGAQGPVGVTGAQGSQGPQGITGIVGDTLAHNITLISGGQLKGGTGTKDSDLFGISFSGDEIVGQSGGVDTFYLKNNGSYLFKGVGNTILDPQNLFSDAKNMGRIVWEGVGPYATTGSNTFADFVYYKLPYEKSLIMICTAYTNANDTTGNAQVDTFIPAPTTADRTALDTGTVYYLSGTYGINQVFGSGLNSSCFWSESFITLFDGKKIKLSAIKKGDIILSYNIKNKLYEKSSVLLAELAKEKGYYILADGSKVTPEHLFYTLNGYREIKDLLAEDYVFVNDEWIKLGNKKFVNEYLDVVKLSVDNNNNYIVNGYLVHNKPVPTKFFNPAVMTMDIANQFGESYPSGNNTSHPNVVRVKITVVRSEGTGTATLANVIVLASRNLAVPSFYGENLA